MNCIVGAGHWVLVTLFDVLPSAADTSTGWPAGHDWLQRGCAEKYESSHWQRAGGSKCVSVCVCVCVCSFYASSAFFFLWREFTHFYFFWGGGWFAEMMWPFSLRLPHVQPSSVFSGWPRVWREFTHFVGRWFAEIMWPFSLPLPHMQPCSICEGWPSVSYFCACKQRLPVLWMFNDCDCTQGLYNHSALRWFPPSGHSAPWPWPVQPAALTLTFATSHTDLDLWS